MRVQGNRSPEQVSVEQYQRVEGFVEVRLRENIDDVSCEGATLFEYDEYRVYVAPRDDLKEHIASNMADWLAVGRVLEDNTVFNSTNVVMK